MINIDEEGYEEVRRLKQRTMGHFMPEIFAVEAEKTRESEKEKVRNEEKPLKNKLCEKFCGSKCVKKEAITEAVKTSREQ